MTFKTHLNSSIVQFKITKCTSSTKRENISIHRITASIERNNSLAIAILLYLERNKGTQVCCVSNV